MKLSIRHILFGIAALGMLLIAYVGSNQVNFAEHKRFDRMLDRLVMLDGAVNRDVLKARARMISNYDGFPGELRELKGTVSDLYTMPSFIREDEREPLRQKLGEFTKALSTKEQLLEDFKSENAVVNNSLNYVSFASRKLVAALGTETEGRLLEDRMEALIQQLLVQCLNSGRNEEKAIRQTLAELEEWRGQYPNHPEAPAVARVVAHVESIITRTPKVESLMKQMISLPTGTAVEELTRLYDAELAEALHRANMVRLVFQAVCVLLLVSVAYTIFELNSANRHLEKRVEERTTALRQSNERFEVVTLATTAVIWDWDVVTGAVIWNDNFQSVFGYPPETVGNDTSSWTRRIHPDDVGAALSSIRANIAGTGRLWCHEYRFLRNDGTYAFVVDRGYVLRDEKGNPVRMVGAMQDMTDRHRAEEALRQSERYCRDLIHSLPVALCTCDAEGRLALFNQAAAMLWGREPELGKDAWCGAWKIFDDVGQPLTPEDYPVARLMRDGEFESEREIVIKRPDGNRAFVQAYPRLIQDAAGKITGAINILVDLTERRQAEHELQKMHRQLLETSRRAGMAEVATGVLHNVGNVLNSVNVSATLASDRVKKSKIVSLGRVVTLLDQHASDLGDFVSGDAQGKALPGYLRQLHERVLAEQLSVIEELESLQRNVDHIKEIVRMQQEYAKVSGVTETVNIADLVEDTLRMNSQSLGRHELRVVRQFADVPLITVEKHKVLQILTNLVRNAKHACDDVERAEKTLTMRIFNGDGTVKVSVSDNGIGIPPENLTRIFNHGFTTKKNGHGFGLHSGALAAKEMGGALRVESNGEGEGATFILELPVERKSRST